MRYFVFSNYINAWSLNKGLKRIGLELECKSSKESIMPASTLTPERGDILFFTEENNLLNYYDSGDHYYLPTEVDRHLLDDKYLFANYMTSIGEKPVPYQSYSDRPTYPVYLKARHSWKEGIKLPRGYILNSEADLLKAVSDIKVKELSLDYFFYQKLLKSAIAYNISTCGFFDWKCSDRNIILVTRKVMGDSQKISTGTIVETVEGHEDLIKRTNYILNNLQYCGPFELEFFYEEEDDLLYVLELNPRFWMQHSIFIDYYDNAVIKSYLNLDFKTGSKISKNNPVKIVWLDTVDFINSIIHRRFKRVTVYLRYYFLSLNGKCRISVAPDYKTVLKYKIKKRLTRRHYNQGACL